MTIPILEAQIRCKRSLYKSTYEGNAFVAGVSYSVVELNHLGTFIRDEEGRSFGPFVDQADGVSYVLGDYFDQP